jgi:hypothetical protein
MVLIYLVFAALEPKCPDHAIDFDLVLATSLHKARIWDELGE